MSVAKISAASDSGQEFLVVNTLGPECFGSMSTRVSTLSSNIGVSLAALELAVEGNAGANGIPSPWWVVSQAIHLNLQYEMHGSQKVDSMMMKRMVQHMNTDT